MGVMRTSTDQTQLVIPMVYMVCMWNYFRRTQQILRALMPNVHILFNASLQPYQCSRKCFYLFHSQSSLSLTPNDYLFPTVVVVGVENTFIVLFLMDNHI